ncbi:hypothetical protein D018_0478B, partial [Vibrio parahaemolyticus VP2007-007]
RRCTTCNTTDD